MLRRGDSPTAVCLFVERSARAGAAASTAAGGRRDPAPTPRCHCSEAPVALGVARADGPYVVGELHAAERGFAAKLLEGGRGHVALGYLGGRRAVIGIGLDVHREEAHGLGRE